MLFKMLYYLIADLKFKVYKSYILYYSRLLNIYTFYIITLLIKFSTIQKFYIKFYDNVG